MGLAHLSATTCVEPSAEDRSALVAAIKGIDLDNDASILTNAKMLQRFQEEAAQNWDPSTKIDTFLSVLGFDKTFIDSIGDTLVASMFAQKPPRKTIYGTIATKIFDGKTHSAINHELMRKVMGYLTAIHEANQIKGRPFWRIMYAGRIGHRHFKVGQRVSRYHIQLLATEGMAREAAGKIKDERFASSTTCRFRIDHRGFSAFVDGEFHDLSDNVHIRDIWPSLIGKGVSFAGGLAGIEEHRDTIGTISPLYDMQNDPGRSHLHHAIEYLVQHKIIPAVAKLPIYLAYRCYFPD